MSDLFNRHDKMSKPKPKEYIPRVIVDHIEAQDKLIEALYSGGSCRIYTSNPKENRFILMVQIPAFNSHSWIIPLNASKCTNLLDQIDFAKNVGTGIPLTEAIRIFKECGNG